MREEFGMFNILFLLNKETDIGLYTDNINKYIKLVELLIKNGIHHASISDKGITKDHTALAFRNMEEAMGGYSVSTIEVFRNKTFMYHTWKDTRYQIVADNFIRNIN